MNVMLLFGGGSGEYEISLRSAAAVLPALTARHTVFPVGVAREGGWYLTGASPEDIRADRWQAGAEPVLLSPAAHAVLHRGVPLAVDAVFPLLHGGLFEGGGIAALCEFLSLPYVGCPPMAGMLGLSKLHTKLIAERAGIPVAAYRAVSRRDPLDEGLLSEIEQKLGYPVFVKPDSLGSSLGAARADSREELLSALSAALALDACVLCEEYLEGTEVELALLERDGEVLGELVGEIDPGAPFYDYNAKYRDRHSRIFIPARVLGTALREVVRAGHRLFDLLGCRGLARVDFFVRGSTVILNEVNTMPGFTDISMFPRLMAAAGLSLGDVLDILLQNVHL